MSAAPPAKDKKSEEGMRKDLGKMLRFVAPFRRRIVFLVVFTMVMSFVIMLPPLFTRTVINEVIDGGRAELVPSLLFFSLATPLLYHLMGFVQVMGVAFIGQRFVMDLRMAVYRHLMELHLGFYGNHNTGKIINRLMGDSSEMQQVLDTTSIQVVSDLVCSLFAIGATFYLNWRLAIPLLGLVVLFVVNFKFNRRRLFIAGRRVRNTGDRLAGLVQNSLTSNMTMKTYGTEDREGARFNVQSLTTAAHSNDLWDTNVDFHTNTALLQEVGRVGIYFLGCAMILADAADYGDVTAFSAYAMQILGPAVRFSMLAERLQNVGISSSRLFEILDEPVQILDRPGARRVKHVEGKVDFDHIAFSYIPERPVLTEFDLHISPGQTVALVGPTGCGKTTVLSLLMRFFEVNSGAIRIDGLDIRDFRLDSLRAQFGIVLQESLLFTLSIADNIRYARPGATMEEVRHAAEIAEIDRDIQKLPQGYDSLYGSRDIQLSVGQKQRISIARAVLADPAIIIMDEATSSLDSESELAIQRAMTRFLKNRTSFIVAHRLSTIRDADRIVLLGGGGIVETGRHEELMAIPNGKYKDLYEKHAGKGVIEDEDE